MSFTWFPLHNNNCCVLTCIILRSFVIPVIAHTTGMNRIKIHIFRLDLRTNSNFCLVCHYNLGIYIRSVVCLLRGRGWFLITNWYVFFLEGFITYPYQSHGRHVIWCAVSQWHQGMLRGRGGSWWSACGLRRKLLLRRWYVNRQIYMHIHLFIYLFIHTHTHT
jgi:hypothetical protein